MPGGRPTKYDPAMCEQVVPFMAQGLSKEAFAGKLGVCFKTVYNWADEHPEFLQALKDGEAASRAFWEQMGVNGAMGEIDGFNASAWIFNMKNRAGWRDKQDVTSDGKSIVVEIVKHADTDSE